MRQTISKMKPMGAKYRALTDRLDELVNEEHTCGCGQDSCDINAAYEHGFTMWATYLFDSSGAASNEFRKLFKKLPKRFEADAERERRLFIQSVEHDECPHCNAVVWHDGGHGDEIHCDSCARSFERISK